MALPQSLWVYSPLWWQHSEGYLPSACTIPSDSSQPFPKASSGCPFLILQPASASQSEEVSPIPSLKLSVVAAFTEDSSVDGEGIHQDPFESQPWRVSSFLLWALHWLLAWAPLILPSWKSICGVWSSPVLLLAICPRKSARTSQKSCISKKKDPLPLPCRQHPVLSSDGYWMMANLSDRQESYPQRDTRDFPQGSGILSSLSGWRIWRRLQVSVSRWSGPCHGSCVSQSV